MTKRERLPLPCRRSPSPELEIAADPHLSLNPSPLPSPGAERELFLGDVYPGWRLRLTRSYCLLPRWGKSDGLAQGHGWTAPATTFPPAHSKARHGLRWQSEARHRFFQFFTLGPLYPLIISLPRPTFERSSSPRPIHPANSVIYWRYDGMCQVSNARKRILDA